MKAICSLRYSSVFSADDLALTDVVLDAKQLRFRIPPPADALFELDRDKDAATASGTMVQRGMTFTVSMERITEREAAKAAAQRAAATARTERDRLLQLVAAPTAASGPGTGASAPGGADATAGLRIVLAECVGAVQTLAEAADADAQRVKGLQGHLIAIGAASAPLPTRKD